MNVLLVDQNGNAASVTYDADAVKNYIHCKGDVCQVLMALPADEGLDKSRCYIVYVKVQE